MLLLIALDSQHQKSSDNVAKSSERGIWAWRYLPTQTQDSFVPMVKCAPLSTVWAVIERSQLRILVRTHIVARSLLASSADLKDSIREIKPLSYLAHRAAFVCSVEQTRHNQSVASGSAMHI